MKHCVSCGAKIGDNAIKCPKCGEPTINYKPKSKTAAVLLAVFLTYWTWAYTYKRDAWKFWLGLALNCLGLFMLLIPNLAVFIWAIIDTAVKPSTWYEQY